MATFRGSKTKLCRALGVNIFGLPKIDKLIARRNNKKKTIIRKKSEYGIQLQEKQIARFMFGISESQLRKYYSRAVRSKNVTSQEMIVELETRVDNVIYRAGFAESRPQARQFISHGHFELNGSRINTPSIQVKPGDKLKLSKKSGNMSIFGNATKLAKNIQWLKPDVKKKEILIESLPEGDELEQSIKVHLIVEFYSRR